MTGGNLRFVADDPYGLWKAGDIAEDRGWEFSHPDSPRVRLLGVGTQLVCLYNPFERGLVVFAGCG